MSLKRLALALWVVLSATPAWALWQGTVGGFYTRCDPDFGKNCTSYGDIAGATPAMSAIATGHRFVDLTHGIWVATAAGTGHWIPQPSVSNVTPGGNNTDVQFNDSGNLNGDDNFTYDKTNHSAIVHRGAGSSSQVGSECQAANNNCLALLPCNTGSSGDTAAPTAGNMNLYCNGVTNRLMTILNGGSAIALMTAASTDSVSNKTIPIPGTGNSLTIGGQSVLSVSGNTTKLASASTAAWASNRTLCSDTSGNITDAGGACGSGVPVQATTYIPFPIEISAASNSATTASNAMFCVRATANRGITGAVRMDWQTGAFVGPNNCSICVYSDDGNTAIIRPAAAVACGVVGGTATNDSETFTSASLTAGVTYNFCWVSDNASGNNTPWVGQAMNNNFYNQGTAIYGTAGGVGTAGLCPTTRGTLTAAGVTFPIAKISAGG